MKNLLTKEIERCAQKLPELEPGTEEYERTLYHIDHMQVLIERLDFGEPAEEYEPDENAADSAEPEAEASGAQEAAQETAPKPEEPKIPKKEDVRAKLADARLKGVDISRLIHDLGADNLSGVDPSDYTKLLDMAEKALEGVA